MAAKRHKKHKNKISGLVISICYNEQKIEILRFAVKASRESLIRPFDQKRNKRVHRGDRKERPEKR